MRVAALYDIHGNLPALEAVLNDVRRADADCLVIGGDAVAGPMPAETLQLLQSIEIPTHFIVGNGEADMLRYLETGNAGGMTARADAFAAWTATQLNAQQQQFLATWLETITLHVNGLGEVLFCHATPTSNTHVFTNKTALEKVMPVVAGLTVKTMVCGHTHMQFDREVGGVHIINAGSVGMPFAATGAHWLLLDETAEFMRTDYDFLKAAERIRQTDYSDAEDFAAGNVMSVPTREKAFEMLAGLEEMQLDKNA